MRTKPTWKDWFVFSKKERTIVIILLFSFVSYCLFLAFYNPEPKPVVIENLDEKLAELSSQNGNKNDNVADDDLLTNTTNEEAKPPVSLFAFDPNTLAESGFQQLGLRDKTIHTIINYRNKGGHFYKPEDLRKIYGLSAQEADRLLPYVKINSSNSTNNSFANNSSNTSFYVKEKPQIIDMNKATVEQWKALPAIGDALSNRIVKYRDKMGGFTSIEQVKKTYGLSDSAYQVILPYLRLSSTKTVAENTSSTPQQKSSSTQKININKATASDLKSIAAISPDVAEAIVLYRKQHGIYTSVEGIKKIIFINDELYQKIAPYLTVD